MHFITAIALLAASCPLAFAAPGQAGVAPTSSDWQSLRLVKTSETDPGQWVEEKDLFSKFTAKGVNFVDITDIKDEQVLAILSGTQASDIAARTTYPSDVEHVDEANELIAKSNTDGPKSWMKTMSDFHTRHYQSQTGTQSSKWVFDNVKKLAASNSAITVKQFTHRYNQPSVIAQIPGENPELVVVGAHQDSTAGDSTTRSPGADDNASGSVTIMEAFRVLAESGFKPKNTLEFHWYSGEEGGLLGSKDVWAKYKSSNKRVVAMLNQDMTGYSPSGKPAIITDNVDSSLTNYVRTIATEYIGAVGTSKCGYGCSDHASARANGFPSAFVFEDEFDKSNQNIHSSRDTMDIVQWDAVTRHIKLTIGFLVEASYVDY